MKLKIGMLALLLALCSRYGDRIESCAGPIYEDSRDVFFYFFDPGLALDARLRPLSFAGLPLATPPWDSTGDAKQDNLEDWGDHLQGRLGPAEIEDAVYQAPLAELQAAASRASGGKAVLVRPSPLRPISIPAEDLAYLVFARRCEPLVSPPADWDPWAESDWRDRPAMTALLEEGRKQRERASSPFIKDRYAFQIVRLAHYSGDRQRAVALFDECFPGPPRKGAVYYWALALKAGALKRLERFAESAYLFSLVFERCRSKRAEACSSFRIDSDETLRQCLSRCRDGRERSVVYFLDGLDFDNSALPGMEAIYRELPDSPHLEVLLTREIGRLERKLHGASFNERAELWWGRELRDPDGVFHENLKRLESFLGRVVGERRVRRADLWRLALGYARYLNGRLAEAREEFQALLSDKATTPAVRQQAETFQWLVAIVELAAVDRESEARLYKEYRRIRDYFPAGATPPPPGQERGEDWDDPKILFLRSALLRLYRQQKDWIRAFLASEFMVGGPEPPNELNRVGVVSGHADPRVQLELVDGLIGFVGRHDRNEFEDYLLRKKYPLQWPVAGVARLLAEQKGMLLMRRCRWAEAAQALERAVDKGQPRSQLLDPFGEYALQPWGSYLEIMPSAREKLEFARRMTDLTRQAGPSAAAAIFYRLGRALYNVSYFGGSWQLLAFDRSNSGDYDPDTTAFLLKEAARRFAQAEKAAKDKELAARACFRQADIALKFYVFTEAFEKALQAQPWGPSSGHYFNEYYGREFLVLRTFANPHFPRLKQQYAGTAYYRQVGKECKLFEYYVGRH